MRIVSALLLWLGLSAPLPACEAVSIAALDCPGLETAHQDGYEKWRSDAQDLSSALTAANTRLLSQVAADEANAARLARRAAGELIEADRGIGDNRDCDKTCQSCVSAAYVRQLRIVGMVEAVSRFAPELALKCAMSSPIVPSSTATWTNAQRLRSCYGLGNGGTPVCAQGPSSMDQCAQGEILLAQGEELARAALRRFVSEGVPNCGARASPALRKAQGELADDLDALNRQTLAVLERDACVRHDCPSTRGVQFPKSLRGFAACLAEWDDPVLNESIRGSTERSLARFVGAAGPGTWTSFTKFANALGALHAPLADADRQSASGAWDKALAAKCRAPERP